MKNIHFVHISNDRFSFLWQDREKFQVLIHWKSLQRKKQMLKKRVVVCMECIPNLHFRIQGSRFLLVASAFILTTQSQIFWQTSNKSVLLFEISFVHIRKKSKMPLCPLWTYDPMIKNHCVISCCLWILRGFIWNFLFFPHIFI